MATIYNIKCPVCGEEFQTMKGILMSECDKPVPKDREEDAPFSCPKCGKVFRVTDNDFQKDVTSIMMAD